MSERVIPGTSFREISEGLIGTPAPGAITVLVVGTACKGPTEPLLLNSAGNTVDGVHYSQIYGPSDPYKYKDGNASEPVAELTLVRAIREILSGGPPPGGMWCIRMVDSPASMVGSIPILDLERVAEQADGIIANLNELTNTAATDFAAAGVVAGDFVVITASSEAGNIGRWEVDSVATVTITLVDDLINTTGMTFHVEGIEGSFGFTARESGQWFNNMKVETFDGVDLTNYPDNGDTSTQYMSVVVFHVPSFIKYDSYLDSGAGSKKYSKFIWESQEVRFEFGSATARATLDEVLAVFQANELLNSLFAITYTSTSGDCLSELALTWLVTTGGTNWSSDDSTVLTSVVVTTEVAKLMKKSGRVLVIAGADEDKTGYQSVGLAHAKSASLAGNDAERVFISGTNNYATIGALVTALTATPYPLGDERAAQVTPGIKVANILADEKYGVDYALTADPNEYDVLSGGYAAAHVAGIVASFIPDQSPLYKNINAPELEFDLNREGQKAAINASFLTLAKSATGSIVIKRSITSTGAGAAFFQLITRMVVDDIRYALRRAVQPFLGEKNIGRVRGIMNIKLGSVMSGYVNREIILGGFSATVTSTRQQQINGVVKVSVGFQPVFYMEFIEFDLIIS